MGCQQGKSAVLEPDPKPAPAPEAAAPKEELPPAASPSLLEQPEEKPPPDKLEEAGVLTEAPQKSEPVFEQAPSMAITPILELEEAPSPKKGEVQLGASAASGDEPAIEPSPVLGPVADPPDPEEVSIVPPSGEPSGEPVEEAEEEVPDEGALGTANDSPSEVPEAKAAQPLVFAPAQRSSLFGKRGESFSVSVEKGRSSFSNLLGFISRSFSWSKSGTEEDTAEAEEKLDAMKKAVAEARAPLPMQAQTMHSAVAQPMHGSAGHDEDDGEVRDADEGEIMQPTYQNTLPSIMTGYSLELMAQSSPLLALGSAPLLPGPPVLEGPGPLDCHAAVANASANLEQMHDDLSHNLFSTAAWGQSAQQLNQSYSSAQFMTPRTQHRDMLDGTGSYTPNPVYRRVTGDEENSVVRRVSGGDMLSASNPFAGSSSFAGASNPFVGSVNVRTYGGSSSGSYVPPPTYGGASYGYYGAAPAQATPRMATRSPSVTRMRSEHNVPSVPAGAQTPRMQARSLGSETPPHPGPMVRASVGDRPASTSHYRALSSSASATTLGMQPYGVAPMGFSAGLSLTPRSYARTTVMPPPRM